MGGRYGFDSMSRLEMELFVYDKIKDNVDYSFDEWAYEIRDWVLHPVRNDGVLAAVVTSVKNAVHVVVDTAYKGKWLTKGTINTILGGLLAEYGEVLTCVDTNNKIGKKFLTRLGFKLSSSKAEEGTVNYVLKELKHKDKTGLAKVEAELAEIKGDLVQKLFTVEAGLKKMPQVEIPTKHYFASGLYAREMNAPEGSLIIGKMHKYSQVNVVSKGDISVLTENGWKRMQAPFTFESPAGVKRAGYCHTDTVWTTFVATNETDLDKIDDALTIGSYQEYLEVKETEEKKCLM